MIKKQKVTEIYTSVRLMN